MRILIVLFLIVGACQADRQFLISSHKPDGIHKVDSSGKLLWTYSDIRHPQDFDVDAKGNIFCSEIPGAKMLSPDGKLLWRYDVPKGCQNPVAQFLGGGRYLVGNEGHGKLLEIDASGKTLKEIRLSPENDKNHGQFRFCRKTPQGTYLAPMTADGVVHEVAADGTIVRGFGKFQQPVSAVRLSNGHTLIGSLRRLDEFDKNGKLVWTFNPVADGNLPEGNKGHVCGIQPLENGEIAFIFYHRNKQWPDLMVINWDKKVLNSIILPDIDNAASLRLAPNN